MSLKSIRRTRWRVGMVAAAVAALLVAGMTVAVSAQAAAGCRVAYAVSAQWPGGFTANVSVTNLGDPINGWSLVWTFPSGQRVTQAWNATVTSSGDQATATNASYNAAIATNATVSFGFNGSWSGSNTAPTSFALNGVTCTGNVGGTTSPTASPPHRPRRPRRRRRRLRSRATRWRRWPRCSPAGTWATRSTPSPTRPPGATRRRPRPCCATCGRRGTRASGSRSPGATTTARRRTTPSTRPGSTASARSSTGRWPRAST